MVMVVVGLPTYTFAGDNEVIAGMGFPPVPSSAMLIGELTPVTAINKLAERAPMAEGVNIMDIEQ